MSAGRRVPHRRLGVGGAVMRVWFGVVLSCAGLAVAFANFRVAPESEELGQVLQTIQAEHTASVTAGRSRVASGDRRTVRQEAKDKGVSTAKEERVVHVAAAPWDRQEIYIGRQGAVSEQPDQAIPTNRYELARAVQAELRRVGCYYGDIDGDWGSGSKRAMSNFTGRINASLPLEAPDAIMLTMVRRFEGQACSATCRSDEMFTSDGRCVPATVLAQDRVPGRAHSASAGERVDAARNRTVMIQPPVVDPSGEVTRTAAVEPLPGRMSAGGPVEATAPVPVTREGSAAAPSPIGDQRPRADVRPRNAQYERSAPRKKRWTQTIFDEISVRN